LLNLLYVSRGETNFQKMTYINLTWTFEKTGICHFFVHTEKRSSISNRIFYHNNRGILILDNVNFRAEKVRNLKYAPISKWLDSNNLILIYLFKEIIRQFYKTVNENEVT
jgi:predicted ATP-grasp superfamily ATP-dependent carboligase